MISNQHRLKKFVGGLLILSVFPGAWLIKPILPDQGFNTCIFHIVTGKPCPFCGLTRAFTHAAHGEFRTAFAFNSLWWLFALIIAAIGITACLDAITGKNQLRCLGRIWEKYRWPALFLLLTWTVVRIVTV